MFISIQQPEYFPWLGYFDKMHQVDLVVFLDNVKFKKRYFENRNKVRTATGWTWVRTPVLVKGRYEQRIDEVEIDNSQPWQRKLSSTIRHSYAKAPRWLEGGGEDLCQLIEDCTETRLVEFNLAVIAFMAERFGIAKPTIRASTLGTMSTGSELILEICRKVGAETYLSGRDGRNYLDEATFAAAGIAVKYQDFNHPIYTQYHGPFEPGMSGIDLMFNHFA